MFEIWTNVEIDDDDDDDDELRNKGKLLKSN
jgi:hypothetical protein